LKRINHFNAEKESNVVLGINKFADLTKAEFKGRYFGYKQSATKKNAKIAHLDAKRAADAIDWRTKCAVTAIKDQG